jgi:RimJ/RimL family protein N-acetyltransferase
MMMREIETSRLLLRMFAPDDLDDLSIIFSDPDVVRHLGTGLPVPRAETEIALSSIIKHWERHGFGRWAAVFKQTGQLIGYGGLRSFQETPELVYLLSKPYWGIGLATEMAQAALRYGFDEQQFERIVAMAKVANLASQRVLEKIGMSFEKTATIFEMEVACYSVSSDEYLSGMNPHQDSLAA